MTLNGFGWALARLGFYTYLGFALFTGIGGVLTAPVVTYYFFGDWRFWRHWSPAWRLFPQGWRLFFLILKGENNGFMLSVPLTSPPTSAPDRSIVRLRRDWAAGSSCGACVKCCEKVGCPVLDSATGLCRGYDSFFWRYFNCGRFPTMQSEIDYYGCPKWAMRPRPATADVPFPLPGATDEVATGE